MIHFPYNCRVGGINAAILSNYEVLFEISSNTKGGFTCTALHKSLELVEYVPSIELVATYEFLQNSKDSKRVVYSPDYFAG